MNRTIKTIAGAAVLVSAVSLVPAFSVGAITLDEVDPIATINYGATEELHELKLNDGTLLFATNDSEDKTNGVVLLANGASLQVTVKNEKVVFEITGDATVQNDYTIDAVYYNGATRNVEVIFNGTTTIAEGKTLTVTEGSSLTLGALNNPGTGKTNAIVNNGNLKFTASVSLAKVALTNGANGVVSVTSTTLTVTKLVNNGTIDLGKNLTIKESLVNNGELIANDKSITIRDTTEGDIFGKIVLKGDAVLDFDSSISDLSSAIVTISGEIEVQDKGDTNPGYYSSFVSDAKVTFNGAIDDEKLPNFVVDVIENGVNVTRHEAKDEGDDEYLIELNKGNGQINLKATKINYSATALIDGTANTITATNTITKVSTKAAAAVSAHISNTAEHNYLEGWKVLDESMNEVGFEVNPTIKNGYTYVPVFSMRKVVTVNILTPDEESENGYKTSSSSEKISNDFTTYGDYINYLKEAKSDLFAEYNVEKLELSLGGASVLAISEDTKIENGQTLIITLVAKPVEEEPEEPGDDEGGDEEDKKPTVDITVSGDVDVDMTKKELLFNIDSSLSLKENAVAAQEISKALADGDNVNYAVEAEKLSAEDIDEATLEAIEKKAAGKTVLGFYDISVAARTDDGDLITNITNLDTPLTLKIKLSEEDRKVAEGYSRTYVVVRVHGSDVSILEATLDEDGYLVFESGLFSTYAVAYTDTKIATVTPNDEDEEAPEVADPTKDATVADGAGFISTEKSAAAAGASIFAIVAAAITAAGVAISKLFKKSER